MIVTTLLDFKFEIFAMSFLGVLVPILILLHAFGDEK